MATNPTIVIADDDEDDRLLIKHALNEYSPLISAVEATDGQSLVQLLNGWEQKGVKPGAIILDINMPRLDGIDALALIRATGIMSDVPVFVLTTMRDKRRVQESLRFGVKYIYTKPNSHHELQQIIRQVCEKSVSVCW